jgi:hypothetical protein
MKKNFFKKLSFVMALAMMVSMVAPAASALGATDPSLYVAKKYLYLNEEAKISEYDFNIKNKVAGSTYAWSSDNEAAVVVDEATGLASAVAVGTAHVTVTVTFKDTKKKDLDLTATVVVRDNIETVDVKNVPTTDLTVGKEYDFNRSFVTFNGSTTKTSSLSRWTVDKTTATIAADSGKFIATEAGEYKVTVNAFQSNAQYEAWKVSKDVTLVKATKTITVKVAVGLTKAVLVTPSKITLTFDSSVKAIVKTAADVKVEQKLSGTYTAMVPVSSIDSVSEDGKTVTFSTYDALADKQTYKVTAAGASTELYALVGTPVSIVLNDQIIPAGISTKIAYQLLDANGVDVSASFNVAVTKNSSVPLDNATTGAITLGDGVVSFVEYTYTIQKTDGTSTTITTGVHTVKGVSATVGTALEWNVLAAEDFSKTTQTVKVGATDQNIYGRIKKSDGTYTPSATYTYTSLTPSVLLIDSNLDRLIPVAAGTALVKVTDLSNNLVSYINLVVLAAPATQSIKADTQSFTLSNDISGTAESKTVTIKAVDQYAVETNAVITEAYVVNTNKTTDLVQAIANPVGGSTITFQAVAGKTGTFTYFVKVGEKSTLITVTVATPGTLTSYVVNASEASVDAYTNNTNAHETAFTVYGVDANGIKKQLVQDLTATSGVAVTYTITGPKNEAVASGTFTGSAVYAVNDAAAPAEYAGANTFTVSIGGIKYAKTFTVTNSRPAPVATINGIAATAANGSTVVNAVASMISLKVGDNAASIATVEFLSTNSAIVGSNGLTFSSTDGTVTLYVTKVTTIYGGISQDVAINRSFTVTVQ